MTITTRPTAAALVAPQAGRRPARSTGNAGIGSRPGFLTYGLLAAFIIGSVYPMWWSVVVASGTNATRGEIGRASCRERV